jgi:hypothetical protein
VIAIAASAGPAAAQKPGALGSGGGQGGAVAGAAYYGHVAINPTPGCNSFQAGMYFHPDGTASFSFNGGEWEADRYNWLQQGDTVTLTIPRGEIWRLSQRGNTLSGTYDDGSCTGTMTLSGG